MRVVLWIFGAWVVVAMLQAVLGNTIHARRWRLERERRDRQELRNLCSTIEAAENRAEQRRWSKS